jgi:hypothetical protein
MGRRVGAAAGVPMIRTRTYRVFCRACDLSKRFSYRETAEVAARTHVKLHDGHEAVIRWWARYRFHDRVYGQSATRGPIAHRLARE